MVGKSSFSRRLFYRSMAMIALCFVSQLAFGQQIKNLTVSKSEDDVIIRFDLRSAVSPQELYDVQIFSSHDNYTTPLEFKKGKSKDVFPGLAMTYIIDAKKTFSGFKGDVDFRVVATLTFIPLTMVEPKEEIKVKAGKSVQLAWKGGKENDTYKLDYSKEGGSWTTIDDKISDKKYTWYVPKKAKGGIYSVKLTSSEDRSKAVYSGNIQIKKKTSAFVIIIPTALAVGAVAYLLTSGGGGGDEPCDTTDPSSPCYVPPVGDPDLPLPPGPPSMNPF